MNLCNVKVPGKGEVVQFLQTSVKNFNKIALKELRGGDVYQGVTCHKQLKVMAEMKRMFSKKGNMFKCKPCQLVRSDLTNMINHINGSHADLLSGKSRKQQGKFNVKKKIRICLERMCDPSLQIEEVVIPGNMRKFVKENESNIYEEAASYLVSKLIHLTGAQVGKRSVDIYLCKSCGINVSPENVANSKTEENRNSRRRIVEHLALVHPTEFRALADQLNVTAGLEICKLLFEVLDNGMIQQAKSDCF